MASTLVVACISSPSEPRCCDSTGELGTTVCGILDGTAIGRASNQPLAAITLRVDSASAGAGYVYAPNAVQTGTDGRFTLQLSRVNRFRVLTSPDTATVELKAFTTSIGRPGDRSNTTSAVLVHFSPSGETVTPTVVTARLELPE